MWAGQVCHREGVLCRGCNDASGTVTVQVGCVDSVEWEVRGALRPVVDLSCVVGAHLSWVDKPRTVNFKVLGDHRSLLARRPRTP